MAYLFKKNWTDGQKNERTNARTDWRSDFIMPQILFGGIKSILNSFSREGLLIEE